MRDKLLGLYIKAKSKQEEAKESIKSFLNNERGDIVQTGIIIGILAILAFVVLAMLRDPIRDVFNRIKQQLENTRDFN